MSYLHGGFVTKRSGRDLRRVSIAFGVADDCLSESREFTLPSGLSTPTTERPNRMRLLSRRGGGGGAVPESSSFRKAYEKKPLLPSDREDSVDETTLSEQPQDPACDEGDFGVEVSVNEFREASPTTKRKNILNRRWNLRRSRKDEGSLIAPSNVSVTVPAFSPRIRSGKEHVDLISETTPRTEETSNKSPDFNVRITVTDDAAESNSILSPLSETLSGGPLSEAHSVCSAAAFSEVQTTLSARSAFSTRSAVSEGRAVVEEKRAESPVTLTEKDDTPREPAPIAYYKDDTILGAPSILSNLETTDSQDSAQRTREIRRKTLKERRQKGIRMPGSTIETQKASNFTIPPPPGVRQTNSQDSVRRNQEAIWQKRAKLRQQMREHTTSADDSETAYSLSTTGTALYYRRPLLERAGIGLLYCIYVSAFGRSFDTSDKGRELDVEFVEMRTEQPKRGYWSCDPDDMDDYAAAASFYEGRDDVIVDDDDGILEEEDE